MRTRALPHLEQSTSQSSGLLAALFLAAALALGGGGSPSPLPELILESLASLTAIL